MRKIIATAGLVAVALIGLAGPATADEPTQCTTGWVATYTTHVAGRPDSSSHGTWASDTFTRTTHVYCNDDGTYSLKLEDKGHFTTVAGAASPNAGTPIAGTVAGRFSGSQDTSGIVSATGPVDPATGADGGTSASQWHKLVFPASTGGTVGAWGWTYRTTCETYTQAGSGQTGDITNGCTPPTKDTVTAPAPAADTKTPATTTGKDRMPTTNTSDTSTTAGVAAAGDSSKDSANGTRSKGNTEGLAYTGVTAADFVLPGLGLLVVGTALVLAVRRLRRTN